MCSLRDSKHVHTPLHTVSVPSAPPASVDAFSTSSTSVRVIWDEVPEFDRNGQITGYDVEYRQSEGEARTVSVVSNVFFRALDGLESFATYQVRVRARTSLGAGPYSDFIQVAEDQFGKKSII